MASKKRQRKQSNNKPELPHDIIIDILLRLPAKSLVRFRCVCKPWHSLITSDYQFIRMQLNHVTKDNYYNRHKVILSSSSSSSIQFLHYEASNGRAVSLEFPLENWDSFRVVGSCNGLLCIAIDMNNVVLWNPSIRECKKLPIPCSSECRSAVFGFGYDSSIDDYKVVRICRSSNVGIPKEVKIYTLKTNSWKKIQDIRCNLYFPDRQWGGTLANGALYWWVLGIPFTQNGISSRCADIIGTILRFDLIEEKFKEVTPPHDVAKKLYFNLGVFGGCLCIVQNRHGSHVEMWALKEDGMKQIWSKLMTIKGKQSDGRLVPICSTENGEILTRVKGPDRYDDVFRLYNPEERKLRKLLIHGTENWSEETSYIESLVSPNGVGAEVRQSRFRFVDELT